MSIARYIQFAHPQRPTPFEYIIAASFLFSSAGTFNAILFTFTRPNLVPGKSKDDREEEALRRLKLENSMKPSSELILEGQILFYYLDFYMREGDGRWRFTEIDFACLCVRERGGISDSGSGTLTPKKRKGKRRVRVGVEQ
ncbi:hypothetical protein SISNIDRAFT_471491 [Sistotremastrum niveocremeum HHB9708]|uniref:Uncharacterized protein n=1 Tax=Sistotremastrum niveocremeum HHB9708 TaxID=1314777 RepID=A0A164MJW5_9AGAM|nr:hypothetical protein SISNIDRAFT_471491 [Sistotremastrum niveocremeum HHB9708]